MKLLLSESLILDKIISGKEGMGLDEQTLRAACYEAARATMWARKPIDVREIEELAETFEKIARSHSEQIAEQGRDPNILVRAVQYLAGTHAVAPMGKDTSWFGDMLEALLELACPTATLDEKTGLFLKDVEEGIARAQSEVESQP